MSDDDYSSPNITISVQLNEMSNELKQFLFVCAILIINLNVFFFILNLEIFVQNTYKSLEFVVKRLSYQKGYNIVLNDCENFENAVENFENAV